MKKNLTICLLILGLTSIFSITTKAQNDYPPVQSILDKVAGKSFDDDILRGTTISQSITANSCKVVRKTEMRGNEGTQTYTGIDWNKFDKVESFRLKNEKKYKGLAFYFKDDITWTLYDENGKQYSTGKAKYFRVYIREKDVEKCIQVVKDWKNSRKQKA